MSEECYYGAADGDVRARITRVIFGTIVELEYESEDGQRIVVSDVPHFPCARFGTWGRSGPCRESGYAARGAPRYPRPSG